MRLLVWVLPVSIFGSIGCAHDVGTMQERGEAKLARLLNGRVPGKPENCLPALRNNTLEIINRTAVVYENGDTIWVARPSDLASLDDRDILVFEPFGGQLCKSDTIRRVDRSTGSPTGAVFLEAFVPYRKP